MARFPGAAASSWRLLSLRWAVTVGWCRRKKAARAWWGWWVSGVGGGGGRGEREGEGKEGVC